jgi:hypothetical protein
MPLSSVPPQEYNLMHFVFNFPRKIVKITETIEQKRTTMCLLSTTDSLSSAPTESDNLTADRRSMKAMSACLNGIPIVSTSWIGHCLQQKNMTIPQESMFVRTLPTKTLIGSISDFGVAYQAARIGHAQRHLSTSPRPLGRVKVAYMVGFNNSSNDTNNFCSLLRLAGVNEVVLNPSVASSRLKEFATHNGMSIDLSRNSRANEYYVVVCSDEAQSGKSKNFLTDAFTRAIQKISSIPASAPSKSNKQLLVVNLQWLLDSVTCGVLLQADTKSAINGNTSSELDAPKAVYCYRPKNEQASKLWQITK